LIHIEEKEKAVSLKRMVAVSLKRKNIIEEDGSFTN